MIPLLVADQSIVRAKTPVDIRNKWYPDKHLAHETLILLFVRDLFKGVSLFLQPFDGTGQGVFHIFFGFQ